VSDREGAHQSPAADRGDPTADGRWQVLGPLDPDEEYPRLKADIRERGVLVPVEVDEHGAILDGHYRVRAWTELRAEGVLLKDYPRLVRVGMTDAEKRHHVLALNLYRRHLTGEARARVIRELRAEGMTLQVIAETAGVSTSQVHRDLDSGGADFPREKSEPQTIVNARGQQRPARYRPRAVPPTTVFATSRHQQARAEQAIQAGSLDALPGIIVQANHPAVLAGVREHRRSTEAVIERPSIELRLGDLQLAVGDALAMPLAPAVVDEVLTSPPYGLDKPYRGQPDPSAGWELFMRDWLAEAFRVLRSPGRLILNVAMDTARGGYRPTWPQACAAAIAVGFTYRTVILWDKRNSTKGNRGLGSVGSADAPYPVAEVEAIGLFSKGPWKLDGDRPSDITHDEWQAWGNGLWQIPGESRGWEGHPAPFPEELVRRLLIYLTRPGDVILDPFVGSGTTAVAAARLGRRFVGYDISPVQVASVKRRLASTFRRED
jgi:site-specific DNA-methyltransferase (adenine-specific)